MKTKKTVKMLTRSAAVAALYTALTFVSALMGLSSGVIQFRLSEVLCLLPLVMPEAVWGLFIGCAVSNLLTGCVIWDVIFGSLATLIGAIITSKMTAFVSKNYWVASLPCVISNALIVPLVLIFAYGAEGSFIFFFITVAIGELVMATLVGSFVYSRLVKNSLFRRFSDN